MTTYIDFTPTQTGPFQFRATLDGNVYNIITTWNLYGQRWYASCYALDGTRVFTIPLIGSGSPLRLASLSWSDAGVTGLVTATIGAGVFRQLGEVLELTIAGNTPDGYNGQQACAVTGQTSFAYPLAVNPGTAVVLGTYSFDINLAAGYFATSTLIWREANGQFEVSP